EIAERIDFTDTRTLLDLAAGPGTHALAICKRYPEVRATIVDLPGPIGIARRLAAERGLSDRCAFVASDIFEYAPEAPFDALLVSNTLHMLGPELSVRLLSRCLGMVRPGGRIIVQAQLLEDERTAPRWATLLDLLQRTTTPHGRNHTV